MDKFKLGINFSKNKYIIFICSFLIKINILYCESCKNNNIITNTECFNNLIIFNDKKYRAGEFAKNKNGDIVIEYSCQLSRLFYGIKQNGDSFFDDENGIKVIESLAQDGDCNRRYESKNIFISLKDDINKVNQYLFSVSSYKTLTELYDLNNDNYLVKSAIDFIGNEIFSYQFQILEVQISNQNIYFCLYIHANSNEEGIYLTIKKFSFQTFSLDSYDNIKNITVDNNCNTRILSSFLIEEDELLAVFFIKTGNKLVLSFYNYDLEGRGLLEEVTPIANINPGCGVFFKSIYIDNHIAGLTYFRDGDDGTSLKFKLMTINQTINNDGSIMYIKNYFVQMEINQYDFEPNITLNDFIKLNNEK